MTSSLQAAMAASRVMGFSLAATLLMLVFTPCALAGSHAFDGLSLARVDRWIDLTSHVVRVTVAIKVENVGSDPALEVLFALTTEQAKSLALLKAGVVEGKGKKGLGVFLPVEPTNVEGLPAGYAFYSIALNKPLSPGESASLELAASFTHLQTPFPAEISQADVQLVLYRDNAFFLSPYHTRVQTTIFKLPSTRIESYTKVVPVTVTDTEVRYGPYEGVAALSEQPVTLHFENSHPFAVVETLEREIEISHWGNIYVTENYHLKHTGAKLKGSFSRFDYQSRAGSGAASFRRLYARLPPRAHSVYYRDEIGNISTSHLSSDRSKTELELEPRYPLFGGWQVTFTLGYSLPLQDFVFMSKDGRRYLNITFGSPFGNVVIDKLVVKVVLPEASSAPSVSIPVDVERHQEVKHTYLDTVGRTVVVLTKYNYVAEHNTFFQVYYRFNTIAMLVEPLLLGSGFFVLFLAFIALTHFDWTISKSSASYQARLQREDLVDALHRLQKFLQIRATVSDRLETALRDLARTGDIAACKAARKGADATFKDTAKELKAILESLQASARTSPLLAKVELLLSKDKEKHEKLLQKHTVTVELYERKLSSKEIDSRIAPFQQKLAALASEIQDLQSVLDD